MRRGSHRAHTRAQPIQPDSIGNLNLWLKADQISGLSDGDPVTTWSDQSGNGYDGTQSTVAHKPTYKTTIINGLPIVRFDGSDDHLEVNNAVGPTKEHTCFVVATTGGDADHNVILSRQYTTSQGLTFQLSANTQRYIARGTPWTVVLSFCAAAVAFNVHTYLYDGRAMQLFCNGRNPRSGPQDSNIVYHADDDWAVGAAVSDVNYANNFQGDIGEIILFSIALAPHQMRGVEAYLGQKWGIRQ